jgi:hypothetical protein
VTPDEADEVVSSPLVLMAKRSSPVVCACLEEACDDIANLTGRKGSTWWPGTEEAGVGVKDDSGRLFWPEGHLGNATAGGL